MAYTRLFVNFMIILCYFCPNVNKSFETREEYTIWRYSHTTFYVGKILYFCERILSIIYAIQISKIVIVLGFLFRKYVVIYFFETPL